MRRYLATDGQGEDEDGNPYELPNWYRLIRAAKYLGVAPWEMAGRSKSWIELALCAEGAEHDAAEERRKHSEG